MLKWGETGIAGDLLVEDVPWKPAVVSREEISFSGTSVGNEDLLSSL